MQDFNFAGIPDALKNALTHLRFDKPTPVQAETIPAALAGNDILATAQTGTGKTAAFGVPLITKILTDKNANALVLLPTRELAAQVYKAFQTFLGKAHVPMAILVGGEPYPRQEKQLQARPRITIGTPGRINDHLERGNLVLKNTNLLVLDEVDRMLDMGFSVQLDAIAKYLPEKRQTLMFSATLPSGIQRISAKYLNNPVRITVGAVSTPSENLKQSRVKVADADKYDKLLEELEAREGSIIVFVKTKRSADSMMIKLRKKGHEADALHGDLRQNKRNRVIMEFRKQKSRILVATDVAARGLDIPHVSHVINYNLPQSPEDYIHRIGRTARAGASGEALNFLSPQEANLWRAIEQLLDPSLKDKTPMKPSFGNRRRGPAGAGHRGGGGSGGGKFGGSPKSGAPRSWKSRGRDDSFGDSRGSESRGGESRGDSRSESRDTPRGDGTKKTFSKSYNKGATNTRFKPGEKPAGKFGGRTPGKFAGKPGGKPKFDGGQKRAPRA